MGTDKDWDKWGATDPYFGVLSADEYRSDNLDEQMRTKFFRSGSDYVGNVMSEIRSHLDASFQPKASLDFGTAQVALLNQAMVAEDEALAIRASFNTSSGECDKIGQAVLRKLETGRNRF